MIVLLNEKRGGRGRSWHCWFWNSIHQNSSTATGNRSSASPRCVHDSRTFTFTLSLSISQISNQLGSLSLSFPVFLTPYRVLIKRLRVLIETSHQLTVQLFFKPFQCRVVVLQLLMTVEGVPPLREPIGSPERITQAEPFLEKGNSGAFDECCTVTRGRRWYGSGRFWSLNRSYGDQIKPFLTYFLAILCQNRSIQNGKEEKKHPHAAGSTDGVN